MARATPYPRDDPPRPPPLPPPRPAAAPAPAGGGAPEGVTGTPFATPGSGIGAARRPPPDGRGAGARPVARHLLALARPGPAAVRRGRRPRRARHGGLHRRADEAHEPGVGGRARASSRPSRSATACRSRRASRSSTSSRTRMIAARPQDRLRTRGPGMPLRATPRAHRGGREPAPGARRQPRARSPYGSCGRASTRGSRRSRPSPTPTATASPPAAPTPWCGSARPRRRRATSTSAPIVGAAIATGCDAVHPGYGFLSERPELAAECAPGGPDVRRTARRGHPPRRRARSARGRWRGRSAFRSAPDPTGPPRATAAADAAERIGYPVLLKASAGGGGRGMVRVDTARRPRRRLRLRLARGRGRVRRRHACSSSAAIGNARHVEVQVLGRHARLGDPPRRAGLLGAAAVPEDRRGGTRERAARALARRRSAPRPRGWPRRSSTSAPARSSSSSMSIAATSRSSRSTRGCRSSTRSPR